MYVQIFGKIFTLDGQRNIHGDFSDFGLQPLFMIFFSFLDAFPLLTISLGKSLVEYGGAEQEALSCSYLVKLAVKNLNGPLERDSQKVHQHASINALGHEPQHTVPAARFPSTCAQMRCGSMRRPRPNKEVLWL